MLILERYIVLPFKKTNDISDKKEKSVISFKRYIVAYQLKQNAFFCRSIIEKLISTKLEKRTPSINCKVYLCGKTAVDKNNFNLACCVRKTV